LGRRGARPADNEIDLNPGSRGPVERFDDRLVQQRIHLSDDASGPLAPGVAGFTINQLNAILGQIDRRDEKGLVVGLLRAGGQKIENGVHRRGYFGLTGQQAQVGIEVRGGRVVVARAQVGILPYLTVGIGSSQQRQLAVSFQSHQPVEHLDPGFLQRTRPADV